MQLADLADHDLGTHEVMFTADDAILYALAVGAGPADLDLIHEQELRVLPTYGCALGLWAVEAAGELGAYDRTRSLHVGQTLRVNKALSPGRVTMNGRVGQVFDKERLTIVEILVSSECFDAGYTILLPGVGGWGGEPPAPSERAAPLEPTWTTSVPVGATAAALYRLTGDKHPVHIEDAVARSMGLDGVILHGLATMGMAARCAAGAVAAHPCDLASADIRLANPVYPGCELDVAVEPDGASTRCEASVDGVVALGGTLNYSAPV
ncbi:MAG: enoyl-CoA hydratase [Actinomycetia bacterium]|nr:enoyl-CoA hydratase [Actinomycetes bacterium]